MSGDLTDAESAANAQMNAGGSEMAHLFGLLGDYESVLGEKQSDQQRSIQAFETQAGEEAQQELAESSPPSAERSRARRRRRAQGGRVQISNDVSWRIPLSTADTFSEFAQKLGEFRQDSPQFSATFSNISVILNFSKILKNIA